MKKNNKGFSLVELIVVVLIMGILAVALTPQVLKWVERSRISTDRALMDSLVSNAQTALTNEGAYNRVKAEGAIFKFGNTGDATYTKNPSGAPTDNTFSDKFAEYCGYANWAAMDGDVHTKIAANEITIVITTEGKVTGSYHATSASTTEIFVPDT